MNCKKKEFIINSIEKHFSSGKYKDYEKEYQECFLVDGQILGRNYFKTYSIQNREDIIRYIQISKSSIMMQYFSNCLTEYNCAQDMSVIGEHLENIFQNINESFLENGSCGDWKTFGSDHCKKTIDRIFAIDRKKSSLSAGENIVDF